MSETEKPPVGKISESLRFRPLNIAVMTVSDSRDEESDWLHADHVLLAAQRPQAISARNIIDGRGQALSPDAAGKLKLARGVTAWAVVKAHAV